MKTAAERQKLARERKKTSGNFRQINSWVSVDAYRSLVTIAKQLGIGLTEALDRLLIDSINYSVFKPPESSLTKSSKSVLDSSGTRKLRSDSERLPNATPSEKLKSNSKTPNQTDIQPSLF